MFDSIVEGRSPTRHLGKGAIASVAMHAALLAGVLYISGRTIPEAVTVARTVTFFDPPAPPPPPPPAGGGAKAVAEVKPKKPKPKKDRLVKTEKPVEPEPDPTPVEEPTPEPVAQPVPGGVAGGVAGGVEGGVVGGTVGGVLGGTVGGTGKGPPTSSAIPFGPGMTRPSIVSQTDIVYTREAKAANVEGTALVKCVITPAGALENCRLIKGLPHLDQAVLAAVKKWRFTPVKYQGRAVSVDYLIPVRLVAP